VFSRAHVRYIDTRGMAHDVGVTWHDEARLVQRRIRLEPPIELRREL